MKKFICTLTLTFLLVFTLVACDGGKSKPWDTALVLEENGYNVSLSIGEKSIKALSAEFGDFFNRDVYCVSFATDAESDTDDYDLENYGLFIYCDNSTEIERIYKKMEKAFLLEVDVVEQADGVVFIGDSEIWNIANEK